MKLCQYFAPSKGKRVGIVSGDSVLDVTAPRDGVTSVLDLIQSAKTPASLERRLGALAKSARVRMPWSSLDRTPSPRQAHLLVPIDPPEVWGAGITYRRSREYYEAHTEHSGRTKG